MDTNVTLLPSEQSFLLSSVSTDGCNILKNSNESFAHWEGIPETVMINGTFSFVLFILFLILTHTAWRRSSPEEAIHNQDIVTFLYGYRDPENWYVIPRYEFVRQHERHHQHDPNYPYIYIPPTLPLANPLEALRYEQDTLSGSNSLTNGHSLSSVKNPTQMELGLPAQEAENVAPFGRDNYLEKGATKSKALPARPIGDRGLGARTNSRRAHRSFAYPSVLEPKLMQESRLSRQLNRMFSCFFKLSDADLIYARGIDSYEYLLFQRHLILIMLVVNALCLGVILPIHWFAGTVVNQDQFLTTSFQRTTIKNMNANSHFHWAHIVCSAIILIATVQIMNSYKASITARDDTRLSRRTLLIGNIPQDQRDKSKLNRILIDFFDRTPVEAIQFVYDFSALQAYESYLSSAMVAKEYCEAYKAKHDRELMVPKSDVNQRRYCDGYCRLCSFCYICCLYWPYERRVPGSEYYADEERTYREKISKACEKMVKEPTEYAFVTFKTHNQARRVMEELARLKQETFEERKLSSRSRSRSAPETGLPLKTAKSVDSHISQVVKKQLETAAKVTKFLEAANVYEDPLDPLNDPHVRSIRSPKEIDKRRVAKVVREKRKRDQETREFSSGVKQPVAQGKSMPTQSRLDDGPLLWSVRYAPHPDNVEYDDLRYLARVSKYMGLLFNLLMIVLFLFVTTPNVILSMIERVSIIRPDRAQELTGFQRAAISYLSVILQVIMTALLPSLMTLFSRQIPYEDSSSKNHSVMWKVYLFLVLMVIVMPSIGMSSAQSLFVSDIDPKCLFPTDNGAYFINYVISSAFLSTVSELIKPTDIVYYYFILWTSRSTAELEVSRQSIEREFSVGLQHTGVLLIFSVVMTYCISCPLIAPAGLLYLVLKHAADHHHLNYTYFTKKVDKSMQGTIVIFVKVALLLMLFQTTVAISLNTGTSYFLLISQIIFWINLAALACNCFFSCSSGTKQTEPRRGKSKHEFCACFYLPKLVTSLLRLNALPSEFISRRL